MNALGFQVIIAEDWVSCEAPIRESPQKHIPEDIAKVKACSPVDFSHDWCDEETYRRDERRGERRVSPDSSARKSPRASHLSDGHKLRKHRADRNDHLEPNLPSDTIGPHINATLWWLLSARNAGSTSRGAVVSANHALTPRLAATLRVQSLIAHVERAVY